MRAIFHLSIRHLFTIKIVTATTLLLTAFSSVEAQPRSRPTRQPVNACAQQGSPLASLVATSGVSDAKTPLILIHGIHGTEPNEETNKANDYWDDFQREFRTSVNLLVDRYSFYLFQYCSDRGSVEDIARHLGRVINEKLARRKVVIVAHSMGGLIAKSYIADRGGDAVVTTLITLATPHHGTPGANDNAVLKPYMVDSIWWKSKIRLSNRYYWWDASHSADTPKSFEVNRSDLRWDNFDNSLYQDSALGDINVWLSALNIRFSKFADKLIAYSGYLKINNDKLWNIIRRNDHENLELANNMLTKGFANRFGDTDGMVPLKSGLFCSSTFPNYRLYTNVVCDSVSRVRRFEPGTGGDVEQIDIPPKTLSITRKSARGYDHLDMFTHKDVLEKLVCDLGGKCERSFPLPIAVAKTPTLFLFDLSGSMKDNDKIGQARAAGLDALSEMRDEGLSSSPVSVMSFAGECNSASVKRLMSFAPNLALAEGVVRAMKATDDATPLPQAKDVALGLMTNFLSANPAMKDGRIVLLSDGQSTCGEIRPPGVYSQRTDYRVRRSSNSAVKFFTIGFDVPAGSVAERDLQFLASETGGKYYNAANREQLIRSFRKHVRMYVPKSCASSSADLVAGLRAFSDSDYAAAAEAFKRYVDTNPNDACGVYNLALAYEASDRYRKAVANYAKYLSLTSNSRDRVKVERKIAEMHDEYAAYLEYMFNLIASDKTYLENFYNSIFNRTSFDLANEFDGFIFEKGGFYSNLPETLEIEDRWLADFAKDISSSLNRLNARRKLASFDIDAVSLLTTPIGHIEELLDRMSRHRP